MDYMMKRQPNSQIAWEMQAYGSTKADILESVTDSISFKFSGPGMVIASYLSDAQEVMSFGDTERARQYINIAKMLMQEFNLGFKTI
jgi:hypothetical protein